MAAPDEKNFSLLQEKANQYRLYVQLSEQKATFFFAAAAAMLAFAVTKIASAPGTAAFLIFLLAIVVLTFSAYAAIGVAVELPFISKPGHSTGRPKGVLYEPFGHKSYLEGKMPDNRLLGAGEIREAMLLEIQQLARLHDQKRGALKIAVWAGMLGASLLATGVVVSWGR